MISHVPISYHLDDIVNIFVRHFRGFSVDRAGAVHRREQRNEFLFALLSAGGFPRAAALFGEYLRESDQFGGRLLASGVRSTLDDEILVLQPLVIFSPQTHIAEKIVTLTNRGWLVCTSIKGVIEWSKQTSVRWSEFDESSDQLPLLSAVDRFVTVAGPIEVLFFSLQGKLVARVPLEESLNYPVQGGESQFGETRSLLLQSPVHIVVYRTSNFSCSGRRGVKSRFAAAASVYYCGGGCGFAVYRAVSAADKAKSDVMCLFETGDLLVFLSFFELVDDSWRCVRLLAMPLKGHC